MQTGYLAKALIQDEAPGVRYSAALELPRLMPHGQREAWLLEAAWRETDPAVRREVWSQIYRGDGYLNGKVLASVLQRGLADTDPMICERTVRLAGMYRVQAVYPTLDAMADSDPDLRVRAAAIQALQCYDILSAQSVTIYQMFRQMAETELLAATGQAALQALADAGNSEAAHCLAARTYVKG